jgi:hypothetical protein
MPSLGKKRVDINSLPNGKPQADEHTRKALFRRSVPVPNGIHRGFMRLAASTGLSSRVGPPSGTYAVTICPSPCDPSRPEGAVAIGHLVLEQRMYSAEEVRQVQALYGGRGAFLYRSAGGEPNACFGLSRPRPSRSYAGLYPAGLTRWRISEGGDSITIRLFSSPDAHYRTTLRVRGGDLHGRGESVLRGPEGPEAPPDSIYARRIGPVDRSVCLEAAARDTMRGR